MEAAELAKFVRQVEIKARGLTSQMFSGQYHAAFRGRGMSFKEVRLYQPGDDVRDIDWNVTARSGQPHIKLFEEERELTVLLLIDLSASMQFGTFRQSKLQLATEIAAVLGGSALKNNDKLGAMLFGGSSLKFIPPKKGFQHLLRIVREIIAAPASRYQQSTSADFGAALQQINHIERRRAVLFALSDFQDWKSDWRSALRVAARRHDFVALRLNDRFEKELPDAGLIQVRDLETSELRLLDSADKATRNRQKLYFESQTQRLKELFLPAGIQWLDIETGEDYILKLLHFFNTRQRVSRT